MSWKGQDTVDSESDEQVFNIGIRAFNFINTFLTDDEIDEFTTIFSKPTLKSPAKVLNNITILEFNLEKIINHLFLIFLKKRCFRRDKNFRFKKDQKFSWTIILYKENFFNSYKTAFIRLSKK
ncbi:hypothetical protein [Borreliella valaisiana]|uniref:Uncharacterized protein n=1 Tax=Borreliella valaisiana VS116 TaxID=445987 RepID=D6RWJ7_BORVA|nr:hypothetical protein [Borreliella valaisiana]EEF81805.1 conserved hypothetical protein [Borreliella valaisiana VS116]